MIRNAEELDERKIEIDLRGEKGNAIYLLSLANSLGKKLGWSNKSIEMIRDLMMTGDYDHLLEVFDYHFGEYVILYR